MGLICYFCQGCEGGEGWGEGIWRVVEVFKNFIAFLLILGLIEMLS